MPIKHDKTQTSVISGLGLNIMKALQEPPGKGNPSLKAESSPKLNKESNHRDVDEMVLLLKKKKKRQRPKEKKTCRYQCKMYQPS